MARTSARLGYGTLLQAGNSTDGASTSYTTIAEVRDISLPQRSLELLDATHQESPDGYQEYVPGLKDGGEVSFEVNWLPDATTQANLVTDFENRTRRDFKIIESNTAASYWTFTAYVSKIAPEAPVQGVARASFTLRISGKPTLTTT